MTRIILCALLAATAATAGPLHVQSKVIYSYTPDADSTCLVSFPFAVNRNDFQFLTDSTDGSLTSGMFAELVITDTAGNKIASQSNSRVIRLNSPAEAQAAGYKIFDRFMKDLGPGVYGARLTVIDLVSKGEQSLDFGDIVVRPWDGKLSAGGLSTAYMVKYVGDSVDDQTARLVDNGYLVLPNPLGVYNLSDSAMWIYAEVYGLGYSASTPGNYRLAFSIFDQSDRLVRDFGFADRGIPGSSSVVTEKFALDGLARGGFRLRMIITDLALNVADTSNLTFWRIESEADLYALRSAFDSLALTDQIHAMKYFLTSTEVTLLESLTAEGQRNFIRQYWQEHDAHKSAEDFVSQNEVVRRYQFVNATFSSNAARNNGWLTDRGRIYMKFGRWEERTDQTMPSEGMPYDIWHYRSVKGGYFFVFVDTRGIQDFRLVHSNAKGERYDPTWEEYFKTQLYMYR